MTVDKDVLDAIDMRVPNNLDEAEIRWWLTIIPEAKRYAMRELKKVQRAHNNATDANELLEEKYNRKYLFNSNETSGMSFTEKKAYAKNKLVMSVTYQNLMTEMNILTEEIDEWNLTIENLNDKSLAIRKLSNFELNNYYQED